MSIPQRVSQCPVLRESMPGLLGSQAPPSAAQQGIQTHTKQKQGTKKSWALAADVASSVLERGTRELALSRRWSWNKQSCPALPGCPHV